MNRKNQLLGFIICFPLLLLTGCWDRVELNDRALWLATGFDAVTGEKGIEVSGQIAVPSNMKPSGSGGGGGGGGGMPEPYFVLSQKGKNVGDALSKMQTELSRSPDFGQRHVIFLGEELAKKGLRYMLDSNTREPDINIRSDIFVVKGGTAKDILNGAAGFELTPAISALKKHQQYGGRGDISYLEFLIASHKKGMNPTIPALELDVKKSSKPLTKVAGLAIFDKDLKLLGFIDADEKRDFLWILGDLKKRTVSIQYKEGGNASLNLVNTSHNIVPELRGDSPIKFTITLSGDAEIFENNTNLDLVPRKNLKILERAFEQHLEKQVLQTVHKVQKEYGVDIFGLGEVIHLKQPQQWKSLKKDWNSKFKEAKVVVKVNLTIKSNGLSGPSLLIEESEIKK